MTDELIKAGVALVLALLGGVVGWVRIDQHGAERERRKQAEKRAESAEAKLDAVDKPPANRREAAAILRALSNARKWL